MTTTTLRLVKEAPAIAKQPARPRRYHLRATVPDRPGSLGAVAAALGRTGGDIVSVVIVERDRFDAVDDITFDLPAGVSLEEVYAALHSVNGIWIEALHPEACSSGLAGVTALLAEVAATRTEEMPIAFITALPDVMSATWAAVWPESGRRSPIIASAQAPIEPPRGLSGMTLPCAPSGGGLWLTPSPRGELEVAVVQFSTALALGVGREGGPPFRAGELEILAHTATVATALFSARP